jgi:tetratricopeptide (TPR) repeat protein
MNHPTAPVLRAFLRSLPVADAGLLLHLLECPRCSRRAWRELSPRPLRRRPGERRPQELSASAEPPAAGAGGRELAAPAEPCLDLARHRRDERRFEEALALFERAARLFGRAGSPAEEAAALGEMAVLHLELRQEEETLSALERVLELGAQAPDPGLASGSTTGIAGRLAELSDPLEGKRLITLLRERLGRRRALRQRLDLTRAEGLLAAFTRQEHLAERCLRDASSGYLRAGLAEQAALTFLDLAALFLRQGRPPALRDLAAEARKSLLARDLPGPLRAGLAAVLAQIEDGSATADLLAALARDLARTPAG